MALVHLRSIFAVMAPSDFPLAQVMNTKFAQDALKVGPGQWLISFAGTAKDLSDALGVSQGEVGSAVIIAASGYYGRADNSIWEWINAKLGTLEYA
jgi:hypothetical protein